MEGAGPSRAAPTLRDRRQSSPPPKRRKSVDFAYAVQRFGGHREAPPPPPNTVSGKLVAATQAFKRSKPLKIMTFELSGVPLSLRVKLLALTPFGYFLDMFVQGGASKNLGVHAQQICEYSTILEPERNSYGYM